MKERQPFSTISSRSSGKEGPRIYGRVRPACLADAPGLPHVRDAEEGDPLRVQCPAHLFQAVAVGGRLHHGHVIFPLGRLLDDVQVMADGSKVDFGPGAGRAGGWHGGERRQVEIREGAGHPECEKTIRLCPCNARRIFVSLATGGRGD